MPPIEEGNPVFWQIDGYNLEIKYPNKPYFPQVHIHKLETVSYYRDIASIMLPYLKDRPATLHYFPRGVEGGVSFYKRDLKNAPSEIIKLVPYDELTQDKTILVPIINTKAGLLYFASKGVIEFHLWNTTYTNYQTPDFAVFDLDIESLTDFGLVLKASLVLKEELDKLKVKSFIKTSGGTGLHVYVPVKAIYTHEQVREWVKNVGKILMEKHSDFITVNRIGGKTHTNGMVTIDYLQNAISRSMVAPYSLRATPKATVSTPLSWKEVAEGNFLPTDFTLKTVPKRIAEKGDLFAGVLTEKQELPSFD